MELLIDLITSLNSRFLRIVCGEDRSKFLVLSEELNIKNIFFLKVVKIY
jgi:hypothetical protein